MSEDETDPMNLPHDDPRRIKAERKATRDHLATKVWAHDVVEIAHNIGNPDYDPELAEALALRWAPKFGMDGLKKSGKNAGETFRQYAQRKIDAKPSLVGVGNGAEIQDIDKNELYAAFGPEKNRTALSRLVAKHGLPKLNSAARAGGMADAFDMRSEYRPAGHVAGAGAAEQRPAQSVSDNNPFKPGPHFHLGNQARLWQSDPTKAKKLMQEAGVDRLGMTQKQIRGGR